MTLSRRAVSRLWEIRVIQVPFTQRAPAGCLQYHTGYTGLIQTMNFADNGRHLANQDYNICMRQEQGMCGIAYEPCHENAFKIGPNSNNNNNNNINNNNNANIGNTTSSNNDNDVLLDEGSGDGIEGDQVRPRDFESCNDKIVLPCDSEDLLMVSFLILITKMFYYDYYYYYRWGV